MKKKIIFGLLLLGSLFLFTNCKAVENAFSWSTWTFANRSPYSVTVTPLGDAVPSYSFVLVSGDTKDVTWYGYGPDFCRYDWYCSSPWVLPRSDYYARRVYFEN